MLYQVDITWAGFELTTSMVIGTECIGNSKSNYQYNHEYDSPNKNPVSFHLFLFI